MLMAGGIAALAAAGGGLAVLVTLTLIGWITAPHVGLGGGLAGCCARPGCSGWSRTTSRSRSGASAGSGCCRSAWCCCRPR